MSDSKDQDAPRRAPNGAGRGDRHSRLLISFVLRLDPAVFAALEERARAGGTTMTVAIATALAQAGYPVPPNDLRDRRRRRDYRALAEDGGNADD